MEMAPCLVFFITLSPCMRLVFFIMVVSGTAILQGQNLLDDEGRRTGHWKVDYPNGVTRYEATFREGNPVGEMIRYYENGAVSARVRFDPGSDRSYAVLFHQNGKKAAEGRYINQLKDSVWTYYSEYDGTVRLREPYLNGELHGLVLRFYPAGTVAESVNWRSNKKEGSWKQYYEDGSLRLSSGYENDMLSGPYEVFTQDSTVWISGTYLDDRSQGIWYYYDEKGSELYNIEYRDGLPVDQEKYMQIMQDTLLKYNPIIDPDSPQYE